MENRQRYEEFCAENEVPLFMQPYWLDLSCGAERWDVVLAEKKGRITGVLPYYLKRKGYISMPPLTPYMGPFIPFPPDMKYAKRLSHEHDVMDELIGKLPRFKYYNQRFHPCIKNWLPFYWRQFRQTTRYTYILPDISDTDKVHAEFKNNVKRNIKKAQKEFSVRELENSEIPEFYEIIDQNRKPHYSLNYLNNLITSCTKYNCGRTFAAFDEYGKLYAAILVVWDKTIAYYILGARSPELQTQQAMSLNLWSAIQFVSDKSQRFDFEGSMIEPVERYFRTYGAIQTRYMHVFKINSLLLKFAFSAAEILNVKY